MGSMGALAPTHFECLLMVAFVVSDFDQSRGHIMVYIWCNLYLSSLTPITQHITKTKNINRLFMSFIFMSIQCLFGLNHQLQTCDEYFQNSLQPIVEMSLSWNFPAWASLSCEVSEPSQAGALQFSSCNRADNTISSKNGNRNFCEFNSARGKKLVQNKIGC